MLDRLNRCKKLRWEKSRRGMHLKTEIERGREEEKEDERERERQAAVNQIYR